MEERYIHLNKWLKDKFGERVLKISIDGGFTCPNRDGKCGYGGCIFCGEKGSGEDTYGELSIKAQVKRHLDSYRGERANKFIAYFQNFTNTYDTLDNLKRKYDESLIDDRIVGLAIATRPDEIDETRIRLIKSYADRYYVWVELGLQTANEDIGKVINRGYENSDFKRAVALLNKYNIDVVTHIMVGLPNETKKDIDDTIDLVNSSHITGVKIHSTYVIKGTKLCSMYENKEYTPISLDYYISTACHILSRLNPNIVIHRISGDAPKELLVAPMWNAHKKWIMNGIDKYLVENDIYQGKYFVESNT